MNVMFGFVSGHGFSRADMAGKGIGFSRCASFKAKPSVLGTPYGTAEQVAEKLFAVRRRADPSRLKPLGMTKQKGLAARLKPCPDTKQAIREFFSSL
jgi:hypothetical protein